MIKVKSIAVNDSSSLFITENDELWANGNIPQIDIKCDIPKKVIFFDGRIMSSVSCGINFWIAISRKILDTSNDDTDDENDNEKVYVNNCSKCTDEINDNEKSFCNINDNDRHHNKIDKKIEKLTDLNDSMNTSVNKNFRAKKLSHVSSLGDDVGDTNNNYDDISNSSKILRQNVSNVASFVCEGVKLISDKVTNLSRQMSSNDNDKIRLTEMSMKLTLYPESPRQNSFRNDEEPSSIGSSFDYHDSTQHGLDEKTFIDAGNSLLSSEVWAWGDTNYGQLGTADNIPRSKPVLITKLQNAGIQKISCGAYHTLALTLDGRVFAWGKNNCNQIHNDTSLHQSSPKQINPTKKKNFDVRATDVAAGEQHSLIIINQEIYLLGKINNHYNNSQENHDNDSTKKIDTIDETLSINYLSSSGKFTVYSLNNKPDIIINQNNINNEKFLLEEMIIVSQNLIKKLQKKTSATKELNAYEKLCNSYLELMSLTALNVKSINDYKNNKLKIYEILLILNVDEFTNVYKYYITSVCDVISLDGFKKMAKIMPEQSDDIRKLYYPIDNWKKTTVEDIITNALQSPINKLKNYLLLILDIINNNKFNLYTDYLKKAKLKWERLCNDEQKYLDEAIITRNFWDNFGKSIDVQKSPERRLIRESRTHPLSIMNYSRFTSHWFILLNDIFIHTTGTSNHTVYSLSTVWMESIGDSETSKNTISMITPEKNFLFYTTTSIEKVEWLNAFQMAIKKNIQKFIGKNPPRSRTASYTFLKHSIFKDAHYDGRWLNGKPHGFGEMKWRDGKIYTGEFYNGFIHGNGKIKYPLNGTYDGEWIDGKQNGFGHYQYENGDIYDGWFKDDLPHGHGVKQEGHLMTEVASLYIGDWSGGLKHGYGIKDDQMTGEKYLGSWYNDLKHGTGIIVTLDGIYYEGEFVNDIMTGHGLMVFDDGTHYEGEIKSAGCFGGKGILELQNGFTIDGIIHGNWNENIKVIATLQLNKKNDDKNKYNITKPPSFSKIGVLPNQKWKSIFRQCYELLGLIDPASRSPMSFDKSPDIQRIWENLAVVINKSLQKTTIDTNYNSSLKYRDKDLSISDELSKIPKFGRDDLTVESYELIQNYLTGAFASVHHPLGWLLSEMASVFNASYGGVRVHPLLLTHAVGEIRSITERLYCLVNLFFPALPKYGLDMVLKIDNGESPLISADGLLHPILLPQVNSALFVLYALHNKKEDDAYWERLIKWNRQNDDRLMELLDVDKKFWNKNFINKKDDIYFNDAIENLQQLKTTFSPLEKLMVIKKTFEKVTKEVQRDFGSVYMWSMDELFPVINFVVIRASVLQLGSEINLIEDFMEPYVSNGELGIMFSTLKASYHQVLNEKIDMTD